MAKGKSKAPIVKSSDLGPPRIIASSHMEELLEGYGIAGPNKSIAVDFLNDLVSVYGKDIREAQKHRGDARKELSDAANFIVTAAKKVTNSRILGRDILGYSAPNQLNGMFSLTWLSDLFPDYPLRPTIPIRRGRAGIRPNAASAEIDMRAAVYDLLRLEGPEVLGAALTQIASALNSALLSSKKQGGRKPNLYRHYFIMSLAVLWEEKLERNCRTSGGLTFKTFCEDVFGYIGWPPGGIERAVYKAIADYYQRSNRN